MVINNYEFLVPHLRASAVLTNAYVAAPVIGLADYGAVNLNNQFILYVHFTLGSLTSGEIIVEFSDDGSTNWVQETFDSINATTGVVTEVPMIRTFTADGNYRIPIKICDKHIRVSAHGTGTVTSSLMAIDAIIGNV